MASTILSQGQAHATQSAVFTGTAGKLYEIKTIWLHNAGTSTQQAKLMFQEPVSSSVFFNESLASNASLDVALSFPFTLTGTGSVYIKASDTGSLNYWVLGREQV